MWSISVTGGEIGRCKFRYIFPDPQFLWYLTRRMGEVGNEGRRMMERILAAYRNGNSVDMLNFNVAKYSFVLWSAMGLYRVSQEEWIKLRESVPYVKLYRYNPKHLYPKLNGYGDNGQRSLIL